MPRARDDLAKARQLRDDLRALKAQYPELTSPESQDRLTTYMSTQIDDIGIHIESKEAYMPAKGDRTLGEDLATLTFKVPASALPVIEAHLREMQRTSRWQRIGRSDALRDIFLRGVDSIENPTPQFPVVIDPGPQLPLPTPRLVEPAAPAYETRALNPAAPLELALALAGEPPAVAHARPRSPALDERDIADLEDMPLELEPPEVTQKSVIPEAPPEAVMPSRARRTARPKGAVAAPSQATPKRKTTRITKGR